MRNPREPGNRRRNEEGALLIILMCGVAVMMIGLAVAFQQWSTIWRRDNEEELIFRGQQYVIALKAYQKEHNRALPTDLEDLMKPGPRQVRYIRKLFRDPMKKGAKWGLLYLMPQGNAIYDPVAAQKGQKEKEKSGSSWTTAGSNSGNMDATGGTMGAPGVYAITDPNGQMGTLGVPNQGVMLPGGVPSGGNQQQGGNQGRMNSIRGGNFRGVSPLPMSGPMPPPREDSDEKSVSETPIGWPIAGVITRVIDMDPALSAESGGTKQGEVATFKIYRGKESVEEWQFHVYEQGNDLAQAPVGTLPGGTPAPFLGPGFGGQGPIGGMGGGARPNVGGMGGRQQGGMQGGGMQGGQQVQPWYPGQTPKN